MRAKLGLAALAILALLALPFLVAAAALPGPVIDECVNYVIGDRAAPPSIRTFRGSLNWAMLADLTGALNGDARAAEGLAYVFRGQLGELTADRAGLYGDESGGGYAPLQHEIALVLIRHERTGHRLPAGLGAIARRWYGAALRYTALTAAAHRDSVLVIGPGSRARSPVADGLGLPTQLTLGALPRRFGIGGGPADRPEYFWRDDAGAARMRRLMGVHPAALAAEVGVSVEDLRAWVYRRDPGAGRRLAAGLRSMHELRIHGWAGGDLLAYWPAYTVGGGPMGGASSVGGRVYGLMPQPVGPRAAVDSQHYANADLEQRVWIEGGLLVGQFRTSVSPADGSRRPIATQRQSIPIPAAGQPALSLVIDHDGAREGGWPPTRGPGPSAPPPATPPPISTPPPSTPPPATADDCRERGQRALDGLLVMRGRRPGRMTADQLEALIREEFGL
jgi:hypothetical protein